MGASREKIYSELDLKSLQDRRCFMFLFLSGFSFTDIHDSQSSRGRGRLMSPKYLSDIIPNATSRYASINAKIFL